MGPCVNRLSAPPKVAHSRPFADNRRYAVDGKAAGVIVAKKQGVTLSGVETQAATIQPKTA